MTAEIPPGFDSPCVLELMGHRRVVGRVREAQFPAGFLRIDEPGGRTQLVNPASVYALHPTTTEVVQALAQKWRSEPISSWDLPEQWRKAITAQPQIRCPACDHNLAEHGANGCGHRLTTVEAERCPCRQAYDPWGEAAPDDGDPDDGDDG